MARVLPDVAGFEKELDYSVPAELAADVRPGCIVRVPLQGRTVRGWVLAFPVEPPAGLALRPVAKVVGWGPEPALLDLAAWAAWRWAGRRRSLLVTASPPAGVRQLPPRPAPVVPGTSVPAGGQHGGPAVNGLVPAGGRGAAEARQLVQDAWRPGTHVLRLPPVYSATDVVEAAAERGPVLVVAPTNGRAAAGCLTLRRRGADVALLPTDWARARAGARIVIGARSAAWAPCPGVGTIVVLDAHDEGLVQEQAPTWDAPAVASQRARGAGVPCLWVTPCPTLEVLAAADEIHVASRATERSGWARLQVVDRRRSDPRTGLYSEELVSLLRDGGQRVVCVLNRKGRALLLDCAACGEVARCEHCAGAVRLVGEDLACRRCGRSRPVVCASCGSDSLRSLRVGVTRAREQLEVLAGRPVGEVTAATRGVTTTAAAVAGARVRTGDLPGTDVLVGTEAVLYRESELRRRGPVGAVAFLDFDHELMAPRYRAAEEALALLARASRLVGGRAGDGRVLVQTRLPGHPVVEAAGLASPERLSQAEEPARRALRLPPFAALAVLSGAGAAELAAGLEKLGGRPLEVNPLGEGRWAVRAPDHATLANALGAIERPEERVRVEVGPSASEAPASAKTAATGALMAPMVWSWGTQENQKGAAVRDHFAGVAKPALAFVVASAAAVVAAGLATPASALGPGAPAAGAVNTTPGTVWAWGDGNVLDNPSNGPALVAAHQLSGVMALAVGGGGGTGDTVYALRQNGAIWSWGVGSNGELGNGTTNALAIVPVAVHGLVKVVAVAGGGDTGYALEKNGTVWAWGAGAEGELGNGTNESRAPLPVAVHGLSGVVALAGGGEDAYAVEKDGTVWAWGAGSSGQLGNGALGSESDVPVQVRGLSGVVEVAGGGSGGFALKKNGTVWAWGAGASGQLGNGTLDAQSDVPVQVHGLAGIVAVAAFNGDESDLALARNGTVWRWGAALVTAVEGVRLPALASTAGSDTPVKVGGVAGAVAIAGGVDTEFALLKTGAVWAWGDDEDGELGNGTHNYVSAVPLQVPGVHGAVAIAGGYTDAYAIVGAKS